MACLLQHPHNGCPNRVLLVCGKARRLLRGRDHDVSGRSSGAHEPRGTGSHWLLGDTRAGLCGVRNIDRVEVGTSLGRIKCVQWHHNVVHRSGLVWHRQLASVGLLVANTQGFLTGDAIGPEGTSSRHVWLQSMVVASRVKLLVAGLVSDACQCVGALPQGYKVAILGISVDAGAFAQFLGGWQDCVSYLLLGVFDLGLADERGQTRDEYQNTKTKP